MSKSKDVNTQDEILDDVTGFEPEPGPTLEDEEEQERERQAIQAAKLKPYRDLKNVVNDHDDLLAEALFEITMLELGMEG